MRKIYIVPNLVTSANLFCGFAAIVSSFEKNFVLAAWLILAAAVFDMMDGRIARLAKATSSFGVQYDSMADLLSFGAAPGALLYAWALEPFGRFGLLASFIYTCCAALRLARFNITTTTLSKAFFQGVASPIAAGGVATFVIFQNAVQWPGENSFVSREFIAFALAVGLGSLMVSNLKFPSFKELNWRSRSSFSYLIIAVLALTLVAIKPEVTLFAITLGYIVLGALWNLYRLAIGKPIDARAHPTAAAGAEAKK